ncbi:MAG TPA: GNAT family protein [Candidatus Woesebacteria bacterium]|nr:GNAT family protein [Candidatus Woesebacteria bacterium]HPR99813.1 GNAT family protein [Candidatus Woesebacteria bacterium]
MKIIYRGFTKTGQKLIIRYPESRDLLQVWRYFNKISAEKTFITYQGEKVSKKDEASWLDKNIKAILQKKSVYLFVFIDGKLSGVSEITLKERVSKHIGSFGITLAPETRGQGIGKLLMNLVISEAQKKLPGLKMITLDCFANNEIALKLYRSLGFIEYGRLPKGLNYHGSFVDEVSMYKIIDD